MDNPANYSKYNTSSSETTQCLLEKYKKFFKWTSSESILEVGSANGVVTTNILYPFVKNYVDTLLGSDISQEAVNVANKMHKTSKVSFLQLDIEEQNLGEKYKENFHHIFAFSVLHLLKTPNIWSKNLYEMLKPNGQLFASVVVLPHPYASATTAQRADKTAPWASYMEQCPDIYVDYSPNAIERISDILNRAGFTIDVIQINHVMNTYEKEENLKGSMLSVNGFLKSIPKEMRAAYTEDFLKRILENVEASEDGSYSWTKKLLVVIATKSECNM